MALPGTGGSDGGGGPDGSETGPDTRDGGDAGVVVSCTGVTFVDPAATVTLGTGDDSSGDACANGFQYTAVVGVTGTGNVELLATSGVTMTSLGTAAANNGQARFTNVTIPQGMTTLSVRIGGMNCTPTRLVTVDCTLPTVSIVTPAGDMAPFADAARRLLAATSTQTFKDANATTAGAQTDVVACTNKSGSARLFAGLAGDAMLMQLGAAQNTAAAVPADQCPAGLSFVAKFPGVTLPESTENADGNLDKATEISVSVTDAATPPITTSSDPINIWVDSAAPTLSVATPTPFCGTTQAANATFMTNVTVNSTTSMVSLSVTNSMLTPPTPVTFGPPTFAAGVATFTNVAFPQGQNTVVVAATEPSGNRSTLAPPTGMTACTVNVGSAPVVTFLTPAPGSKLCAVGNMTAGCAADSNLAAPGWQNPITIRVTNAAGAPITTGNVSLVINMGAPQVLPISATGIATLANATIPEGTAIVVTATTDNAPPVGTASQTFQVDTRPPEAPTALTAVPLDRRQTSFTVGWTAPADQGQPNVAGYDVRVTRVDPMTMACGAEVKAIPFTTTPKAATMTETVAATGLLIENNYCFTVVASDAVGNVSPTVTARGRADFNVTTLTGMTGENFGIWTDGTGDFGSPVTMNGFSNDRLSDLLVGVNSLANGQRAYMYFGRPAGYAAQPDVTFTGPAAKRFGQSITAAGDLDGDGLTDIAISAPGAAAADIPVIYIFSRKTAPWALNGGWPATVDYTQATYTITGDSTYAFTNFGQIMTPGGNLDGAGSDDLVIGAYFYAGSALNAGRTVIVKGSPNFASITLPDPVNTIVIDGEAADHRFGRALQVLADGTLVVSAPNAGGGAGRLYAFRPPFMPMFTASAATAFDVTIFAGGNAQYGTVLGSLGPIGPSAGVVTASATAAGGNFVDVHIAPVADGVFSGAEGSAATPSVRFTSSTTGIALGIVNIGGSVPGLPSSGSLIGGDTVPDLVIAGQTDATNPIYIVNGATIPTLSGTVDLATAASGVVTIRNELPTGWIGYGRNSTIIPDVNGDGYADMSLGEITTTLPGRTLVFW